MSNLESCVKSVEFPSRNHFSSFSDKYIYSIYAAYIVIFTQVYDLEFTESTLFSALFNNYSPLTTDNEMNSCFILLNIFPRAKDWNNMPPKKSHTIHQVIKGARNLQREGNALLKQSENRFLCDFRGCFVVNLDDFFTCDECKPGRHFFPSWSEVKSTGYSEFD